MTRYRVHANQSYVVYGSSLPTLHPFRAATDGTCIPNPAVDPSLVARIPLSAPRCPASFLANASATKPVQTLPAQPESNPCLYFGSDLPLQGADGDDAVVNAGGATGDKHIRAYFQNPQIRFVINNLDGYAADLLSIHFEFQYGFQPLVVQIPSYEVLLTMGTRIFTGPTKTPESPILQNPPRVATSYPYLYVVDQGRTALTPASRGQVLRINPRSGTNEIAAFDATLTGNTPFQLQ
jgi:hypothetical protein